MHFAEHTELDHLLSSTINGHIAIIHLRVKLCVKASLGEREMHVHLFCTVESHFLQAVYLSLTLCLCRFTNVSRAQKSWSGIRYSLKSNMLALEAPRRLEAKQV